MPRLGLDRPKPCVCPVSVRNIVSLWVAVVNAVWALGLSIAVEHVVLMILFASCFELSNVASL